MFDAASFSLGSYCRGSLEASVLVLSDCIPREVNRPSSLGSVLFTGPHTGRTFWVAGTPSYHRFHTC